MAEHKRSNSFRKLFPTLFLSRKSKEKRDKELPKARTKGSAEGSSATNHYQNPKSIIKIEQCGQRLDGSGDCIYENVGLPHSLCRPHEVETTTSSDVTSNHSSSSTLVSGSVKSRSNLIDSNTQPNVQNQDYSAARPQVPPLPQETPGMNPQQFDNQKYPDVYYHSLEQLNKPPLNQSEIYRDSYARMIPESVGAEIKKVSTKFLISPKKEAEVRTIQPTRARSLSFNKTHYTYNTMQPLNNNQCLNMKKPYNYSAPTSPNPVRIPSMPKTMSPYASVRKTIVEIEEKKNSLDRIHLQNKSSPSPKSYVENKVGTSVSSLKRQGNENKNSQETEKEKTRQRVEAFYWQKLKELKDQEDKYFLRQSVNRSSANNPTYSSSNSSTPSSMIIETRSTSLPCTQNFSNYSGHQIYSQPVIRGAQPEKLVDPSIYNRGSIVDSGIIYRRPEKVTRQLAEPEYASNKRREIPISQRSSLSREFGQNSNKLIVRNHVQQQQNCGNESMGVQPWPSVPSTANTQSGLINARKSSNNVRIQQIGYQESESGSEAGEIQRILQDTTRKGRCRRCSARSQRPPPAPRASRPPAL